MLKLCLALLATVPTAFYTLSFTPAAGGPAQAMSAYQGKKVLLVNIATGSSDAGQLTGLQRLQQQYGDSLVVIAFPSNSFGNEPRSDSAIQAFCHASYQTTFAVAKKAAVTGSDSQPVYDWLAKSSENGSIDGAVQGDFQKFLISSTGEVVGVYAAKVQPMDTLITHAVMRDL